MTENDLTPAVKQEFGEKELQKLLLQDFIRRLNQEPNPAEFEATPDGKAKTLPISFVEMTLDELFLGQWETRDFKWAAITNEVQGSVTLVLTHPVTGHRFSRVGAASIIITVDSLDDEAKAKMSRQDRNLYALNPENKKPNALDLGFPKLKAECVKNAAQSLGKVFGRDINRKKKDSFKPPLKPISNEAFLAAVSRVEGGQLEVIALAESAFLLTDDQKLILNGAKPAQKQLQHG